MHVFMLGISDRNTSIMHLKTTNKKEKKNNLTYQINFTLRRLSECILNHKRKKKKRHGNAEQHQMDFSIADANIISTFSLSE